MPLSTSSFEPVRRRAARMVVLFLVLAGTVEVASLTLLQPLCHEAAHHRKISQLLTEAEEGGPQLLILGDSSGAFGVDAQLLGAELAQSPMRATGPGSLAVMTGALVLEQVLASGQAPARVLVVVTPDSLEVPLDPAVAVEHGSISEAVWMWRQQTISGQGMLDLLPHAIPSYRYRRYLGELFGATEPDPDPLQASPFEPDPSSAATGIHPDFADNIAKVEATLQGRRFKIHRRQDAYLRRLLETAGRAGAATYLVMGPLYRGVYQTPEQQAYFNGGLDYLGAVAEETGATLLLPSIPLFEMDEMHNNYVHVNPAGRERFSQLVLEALRNAEPAAPQ